MIITSGRVRAYPGEPVSGDAVFIAETPQGTLLALVDALGHGPMAASAAELAVETIAAHRHERPARIVEACHERLLRGRGAVMSVILLDPRGEGVFAGVGNVSARLYPESPRNTVLLPSAGVVGHRYRTLRELTFRLPGDGIGMLYSDGISSRVDPLGLGGPKTLIDEAANSLLATFAKASDDASLILFAHRGGPRFSEERVRSVS
jgi:phosphoserine phosphatase RsbX